MIDEINWRTISDAITFYQNLGFDYVEVPWMVDEASARVTLPPQGQLERVGRQVLIASGEQGFVDLERDSLMPTLGYGGVNYVTCTPCFRAADNLRSDYHHPYFMKVELYSRCESAEQGEFVAKELMNRAYKFMFEIPEAVKTDEGWDLEICGIEVGSYGWREHPEVGVWAYGTGVAEPRYSQAVEKWKQNV